MRVFCGKQMFLSDGYTFPRGRGLWQRWPRDSFTEETMRRRSLKSSLFKLWQHWSGPPVSTTGSVSFFSNNLMSYGVCLDITLLTDTLILVIYHIRNSCLVFSHITANPDDLLLFWKSVQFLFWPVSFTPSWIYLINVGSVFPQFRAWI